MSNELLRIIVNEIEDSPRRAIPFPRYMELALYHPRWGYYSKEKKKLGKDGDFYTSVHVGDVFGKVLSSVFSDMRTCFPSGEPWFLVEAGPGDGRMTAQILEGWRESGTDLTGLRYYLVETSPYHRRLQRERLNGCGADLRWVERVEEIPREGPAILVSNELLDAFPVHRIRKRNGTLREIYVTWNREEGKLREWEGPLSRRELADHVEALGMMLEEGQTTEVNLAAREWLRGVARWLDCGFVITMDYGGTSAELLASHRREGTLRCYSGHRLHTRFYDAPGESDITSDVNFQALQQWGEEAGLQTLLCTTQSRFLMRAGILRLLTEHQNPDPFSAEARRNRAVRQLIHPGGMGEAFRVLIQFKGMSDPRLRFLESGEPWA